MSTDPKQLLDKISNVDRSEYDDESKRLLDTWTRQIEVVQATQSILDSFIIQEMIASFTAEIEAINYRLTNDANLSSGHPVEEYHARLNLLDKKAMYNKFLTTFDVQDRLESIAKVVNEKL